MTQPIRSKPVGPSPIPETCPICLDSVTVRAETVCKHVFDKHCLDSWLKEKNTCPLCRKVIKEVGEETQQQTSRIFESHLWGIYDF